MVTTVRGQFSDFAGTAHIDVADPSRSKVALTIQIASVDTGVADRDGHLRSGDFFDAEAFPTMAFTSTSVVRDEDGVWQITGDLTIKDVTRSVTIPFEETGSARDPFGNVRVGFEGGDRHQPQGLGPHLERRARDRRRARLREGQAGVRRLRRPVRLTSGRPRGVSRDGANSGAGRGPEAVHCPA